VRRLVRAGAIPTRQWRFSWWAPLLLGSLMASALLVGGEAHHPAGWLLEGIALVPLFAAIRLLRRGGAAFCGALWGFYLCLALALQCGGAPQRDDVFWLALVGMPALYAYGASALTERFGFQPLLLAVAWLAPEFVFHLISGRNGIVAQATTPDHPLSTIVQLLGWLILAGLIAYVNAKLAAALGRARVAARARIVTAGEKPRIPAPAAIRPTSFAHLVFGTAPRAPPLAFR
jgi:apolipoprotein N-acyltransferase